MITNFTNSVKMRIHTIEHINNNFIFIKFYDAYDDVIESHLFTNNTSHTKHISQKNEKEFETFIDQLLHEFDYITHNDLYYVEVCENVTLNKTSKLYELYQSLYNNMKEKNVIIQCVY